MILQSDNAFLTYRAIMVMIGAMQFAAQPSILTHLIAFLRHENLPLPAELVRFEREAAVRGNLLDVVSPQLIIRALDQSAQLADRRDLSILFAQWPNSRGLGPLSLVAEQCPTLRYMVQMRRRYVHVINSASYIDLQEIGPEAHIVHSVLPSFRAGAGQFLAGLMASILPLLRRALGPNWTPIRAELGYERPPDQRSYERLFRCPVVFSAAGFSIVCRRADVDRPLAGHDPEMLAFVEAHLNALAIALPLTLEAKVERILSTNIEAGMANVISTAKILGMSPRTLQRQLLQNGKSFSQILEELRRQIVLAFFREQPTHPITALAYRLGYPDTSTVSRFVQRHFAMSSSKLRRQVHAQSGKIANWA